MEKDFKFRSSLTISFSPRQQRLSSFLEVDCTVLQDRLFAHHSVWYVHFTVHRKIEIQKSKTKNRTIVLNGTNFNSNIMVFYFCSSPPPPCNLAKFCLNKITVVQFFHSLSFPFWNGRKQLVRIIIVNTIYRLKKKEIKAAIFVL